MQFKHKARLLDVFEAPEGLVKEPNHHVIILESTIFHPQGGGQPNDEGVIRHGDSAEATFRVNHLVEKEGAIWHVGVFEPADAHALF